MNLRRVRTVYVKELIDILRDHRTLVAMLVVPVVLYPMLMVFGIQVITAQTDDLKDEHITLGFARSSDWDNVIKPLLEQERIILQRQKEQAGSNRRADDKNPTEIPTPLIDRLATPQATVDLRGAVLQRTVDCGVIVESVKGRPTSLTGQVAVTILNQPEEIRSVLAARRLREALNRVAQHRINERLARLNIDIRTIEPIVIEDKVLTTSGSVLGLILPLILVLMTITGAIYPAIDLTAGERERGTLESLMVCPVPVIELIFGKFLVVTTIALVGAALNLASVTATIYLGGFNQALQLGDETGSGFPFAALPVILVSLVPFAVLMSAVMIALSGCARTFKEAQNYLVPVILVVLVPGSVAFIPGTRLEGAMLVTPVANMVLLTRDLLSGAQVLPGAFAMVLLSTSLYAAVAVVIAARVFGRESVVFSDSLSLRAMVSRRYIGPSSAPPLTMAALYAALLFPLWFYVQGSLQLAADADLTSVLTGTAVLMPILFVAVPVALLLYWKVNARATLCLNRPPRRFIIAAAVIGLTAWVPAHELFVLQERYIGAPPSLAEMNRAMVTAIGTMPVALAIMVMAVVPALCEELFFRGFLLSGLRTSMSRSASIIIAACAFGLFHFFIFKFAVTAVLGILLGWLCVRARSIWPAIITHALHNATAVAFVLWPGLNERLGLSSSDPWAHLPPILLVVAGGVFCVGLAVTLWPIPRTPAPERFTPDPIHG